jgi:mannose-6-phosphate isomerase-like protein (cupin superfamily)
MHQALHPLIDLATHVASLDYDRRGAMSLAAITTTTGPNTMPALHVQEQEEAYHVLSGVLTLFVGDEEIVLGPGESHLVPAGVPHTHRAETLTRHLTVAAVVSVSRFEDFVRSVHRPVPELAGDWPESTEAATLTTMAAANGITVLAAPGVLPGELVEH